MGGGGGFGAFGGTQGSNQRERLLSSATNPRVRDAIDQLYRPSATVGDGGLADAIRRERDTGGQVGGKSHLLKGKERLKSLRRILSEERLNEQDRKTVERLIKDLEDAMGRH